MRCQLGDRGSNGLRFSKSHRFVVEYWHSFEIEVVDDLSSGVNSTIQILWRCFYSRLDRIVLSDGGMGVVRRIKWIVMGAILLSILLGLSRFHRVTVTKIMAGPWVASVPFGSLPDQAGRTTGIDGRHYGPLTFASNGRVTVVADTYHQRLLYFRRGGVTMRELPGAMVEDLSINKKGQVLIADNRALTLWLAKTGQIKKVISLPHRRGYSKAIWHVSFAFHQRILVEWVRFGQGTFSTRLDEYNDRGQFVRSLAASHVDRGGLKPLMGRFTGPSIKNFQVAPNGSIYVEPEESVHSERVIHIYTANGLSLGHITIRVPQPLYHTDFLGIDARGWIFLATNIHMAHKARLLAIDSHGQVKSDIPIAAVPVYAATYGRVLASGAVLLDQSTPTTYRIREYRPLARQVWRWTG